MCFTSKGLGSEDTSTGMLFAALREPNQPREPIGQSLTPRSPVQIVRGNGLGYIERVEKGRGVITVCY